MRGRRQPKGQFFFQDQRKGRTLVLAGPRTGTAAYFETLGLTGIQLDCHPGRAQGQPEPFSIKGDLLEEVDLVLPPAIISSLPRGPQELAGLDKGQMGEFVLECSQLATPFQSEVNCATASKFFPGKRFYQ